ncbi:hypothetical protein [Spirosoma sordidisoli]|uniref:Uncharacterized protein n=1 Tax=Spirosoma sordidisoli TaxID=2502893 RepID=A0A4Q2USY5_9BACT|nr:hypothetical protein [Spirosoma sordidisoli]RYC70850.1 hypothetical protein EQG79_01480 [Spirosoma sordidisoli]
MATETNALLQLIDTATGQVDGYGYVPDQTTCETRDAYIATAATELLDALPTRGIPGAWDPQNCLINTGLDIITNVEADSSNYPPDGVVPDSTDGFDFSYTYSQQGQDASGNSFVSTPAPILAKVVREAPRQTGNYYDFPIQSALNTVLHKRHPQFVTHPKKVIIYPGRLYSNPGANDLIGRGWTHTSESAKQADVEGPYPTEFKRALEMPNYPAAAQAASMIGPSDPRYQQLMDWANQKILITDESACQLYAQFFWQTFRQADWWGGGVEYFSVNQEVFTPRPNAGLSDYAQWYRQVGWLSQGIINAAAADGFTVKTGFTDHGNLCTVGPWFHDDTAAGVAVDPDPTIPRYMHFSTIDEPYRGSSQAAPLGENSVLASLVKQGKGYVGVGSYQQHTFDDQSLFQKNSDGSFKVVNGELVWRTDRRITTIASQSCQLYEDDTYRAMLKIYGRFARYAANIWFRAGCKHLPMSTDRQTGWENMLGQSCQFRVDGESETGLSAGFTLEQVQDINRRPLNPDWTEGIGIADYLFADYIRGWMQTQFVTALGAAVSNDSTSRASLEIYQKAFNRAAQLNWINDVPWRLVQPKFWIFKQGGQGPADPFEAFYRKPILTGGLAVRNGETWLWLYGWWPCQDVNASTTVTVWGDIAGVKTPAYTVLLDGRSAFLEDWVLPATMNGIEPKHLYFQFTDFQGQKHTWRGDYREARITNHPTPPAA